MASVRILLVATVAVMIATLVPAVAAGAGQPGPVPVDDLSRFESATGAPNVSVTVDRRGFQLRAGRKATYTIRVENHGANPESLTIRVSLPPWLTQVAAGDGGEAGEGTVVWSATVEPADTITRRLTGTYIRPGRGELAAGPVRAALTACVLDEEGNQPIVCATDVAELKTSLPFVVWLLIAAAVVVLAGLAVVLLRRYQRRRSAVSAVVAVSAAPHPANPPR